MKTLSLTLPSFWASYLFYGDTEGLLDDEQEIIDVIIDDYNLGCVLSCADYGEFDSNHDARNYGILPCDCLEYIFPIKEA